jgi:hypothetical protein
MGTGHVDGSPPSFVDDLPSCGYKEANFIPESGVGACRKQTCFRI